MECSVRSYALAAARNAGLDGTSNAAATEGETKRGPVIDDGQVADVCTPTKQVTRNDTTLSSVNEGSQEGNTTEDVFDSATGNSSESEGEPTCLGQAAPGTATLPTERTIVTCEQTGAGADHMPNWETAKSKTRKRKKVSLSSDKSPDHKKAAQEHPAKPL